MRRQRFRRARPCGARGARRARAVPRCSTCTPTRTTTGRVFTLAGPGRDDAAEPPRAGLAAAVADASSLAGHEGVHPRLGCTRRRAVRRARGHRRRREPWPPSPRTRSASGGPNASRCRCSSTTTPTPTRRDLPSVRRDAFRAAQSRLRAAGAAPAPGCDRGRRAPAARRDQLRARDRATSGSRARSRHAVRERDGGLPGVRALGFLLEAAARAQVSMNLVDLERTGIEAACTAVRDGRAARRGDRGQPRRARRPRPGRASSNAAVRRVPRLERRSTRGDHDRGRGCAAPGRSA